MAWITKTTRTYLWDAGARSIASLPGNGVFTFTVGQSVGIVCGLNESDLTVDYREINHAFWIEGHKYRIIESGTFNTALALFTPGAVFRIERFDDEVQYFIDDVWVFTSTVPSTGTVFLDASLLAYNDSIIDITCTEEQRCSPQALLLGGIRTAGRVSDDDQYGSFLLGGAVTSGSDEDTNEGTALLRQLIVSGGTDDFSYGRVLFPSPIVTTNDLLLPDINVGAVQFNPLYVRGTSEPADANLILGQAFAHGSDMEEYGGALLGLPRTYGTTQLEGSFSAFWGQFDLTISVLPDGTFYDYAGLFESLQVFPGCPLAASATTSASLGSVQRSHGTVLDSVHGADLLTQTQHGLLTDSQGSSDALWSGETAALGDTPATTETLSGIRALHGTLSDSVATTDACSTGVDGAIVDDQASSLALQSALWSALAEVLAVAETLGGRRALHAILADAALSTELLSGYGAASLADSVTGSDAWVSWERSLIADSVSATEVLSGRGALHGTLAESVQISERLATRDRARFDESVTGSDVVLSGGRARVADTAAGSDTLSGRRSSKGTLAETTVSADHLFTHLHPPLSDSAATSDSWSSRSGAQIAESPAVSETLGGRRAGKGGLADSVAALDTLGARPGAPLADSQGASDALAGRVGLHGPRAESQGSTDTLSGIIAVYGVLADTTISSDTLSGRRALLGVLADTEVFGDTFSQQSQTVYAINADTGAVSEYVFTPLIQGATFMDGTLFLATPVGLFALDATTDAGTPIDWELRTGFTNMSSDALKRITDVNVLGESSSDVGVGLVTSRYGVKDERRYERVRLTRDASRDGVIKTGRGPVSVYWQVSVAGVGPAEINELRLSVEPLSRRR